MQTDDVKSYSWYKTPATVYKVFAGEIIIHSPAPLGILDILGILVH